MIKLSFAALAAAASVWLAAPASAGVILDQATIPATGHIPFAGGVGFSIGTGGIVQDFTVGVSGRLDHVAVDVEDWTFIGPASDVRFDLVDSSFHSLFSQTITAANLPVFDFSGFDWATVPGIDLSSAGIAVHVGDVLGLKLSSLNGADAAQVWRAVSGYSGGDAYSFDAPPGFPLPVLLGNKFGFRTFVDTGVPEPQTWTLAILGFAMAGAALRGRRTARAIRPAA